MPKAKDGVGIAIADVLVHPLLGVVSHQPPLMDHLGKDGRIRVLTIGGVYFSIRPCECSHAPGHVRHWYRKAFDIIEEDKESYTQFNTSPGYEIDVDSGHRTQSTWNESLDLIVIPSNNRIIDRVNADQDDIGEIKGAMTTRRLIV